MADCVDEGARSGWFWRLGPVYRDAKHGDNCVDDELRFFLDAFLKRGAKSG